MVITLLQVRARLGLTLEQTAALSGLSKSTVSNIENGKVNPKFTQIEALAKGLQVKISDIVQSDYY